VPGGEGKLKQLLEITLKIFWLKSKYWLTDSIFWLLCHKKKDNLYPMITGLKGIVQRDLTGVETRLKRSALMNYIVAKFVF
jgi:hypothetical protein